MSEPQYTAAEIQLSDFITSSWFTMAATHALPAPWAPFDVKASGPFLNLNVPAEGGLAQDHHFHTAGCELILEWTMKQPM
jgi:hypothetical protein